MYRFYACKIEDKHLTCSQVTLEQFTMANEPKAKICAFKDNFLDPMFLSYKLGKPIKVSR
jgi:hypothetical protein